MKTQTIPAQVPTKYQVREYLQDRAKVRQPVPSSDEIRRQLGWFLK